LLTIASHYDSASVARGLSGDIPQTLWLMDYPLLERTYYILVVNYNVFGNVAHQLLTRLYFDLIRNSSEHNFLRLIPEGQRSVILHDWYQHSGKLKFGTFYEKIDDVSPSAERFATENPKRELALRILRRFEAVNAMADDPVNRCQAEKCARSGQPLWIQKADQALSAIASRPVAELPGINRLPEVMFVRVRHGQENRTVYTLLRDRAHSNVAFILRGTALSAGKRPADHIPRHYRQLSEFHFRCARLGYRKLCIAAGRGQKGRTFRTCCEHMGCTAHAPAVLGDSARYHGLATRAGAADRRYFRY